MKKFLKRALVVLLVVMVGIQFVPTNRDNPPVASEITASGPVKAVLERCCYDCHSNETSWPWYSHVAPFSWLIEDHVEVGRKQLNFSTWGSLTRKQQKKMMEEILEEAGEGEMPPWDYTLLHGDAAPTEGDVNVLRKWVEGG